MSDPYFVKLVRPEPIARATAVLNVSFERSDVPAMRRFLEDFGLHVSAETAETTYFRGHGDAPWLVSVKHSRQDRFVGMAFAASESGDLTRLAETTSSTVEQADDPGGGRRVRLIDPDGNRVDFVHGYSRVDPLPTRHALLETNTPDHKSRVNNTVRTALEPAPLFKLGHVVLQSPDFDRTASWYMRHFGIIPSDIQAIDDGRPALGFFRLDRGAQPADHHSIALLCAPGVKLLHVSFETFDVESVGQGNQYLRARGHQHHWGIGRHVMGSQVFDYWKDPVGDEWEHYADGDVMTADYPTVYSWLNRGSLWSWGEDLPDSLRPQMPLNEIEAFHASGTFGNMDITRVRGLLEALDVKPRPWLR